MTRLVAVCLVLLPLAAQAELFRWRDAGGKVHIGDNLPAEAIRHGYDILDNQGRVIRRIEPAPTEEELRRRELERIRAERERRRREAQAERDRVLLLTYGSVEEIETARDERLALLRSQIRVNEERISALREELARLEERARRGFTEKDKPVPEELAERISRKRQEIADYEQRRRRFQEMYNRIERRFAKDIQRFRELEEARRKLRAAERARRRHIGTDELR